MPSPKRSTRTADLIKGAGKSANDPEARKIGDYYDAFMDESAIEKKGSRADQSRA